MDTHPNDPIDAHVDRSDVRVDVIDVLDGFFYLRKRSSTLYGDAPVRATQACPPFTEGSAFGYELRYSGSGIAIEPEASTPVRMLDELTPGFDYTATVRRAQELLEPAWYERLADQWWWRDAQDDSTLHVWTGLIARPEPACAARVTQLYNSPHLRLDIDEQVITDSERYTPLVLSVRVLGEAAPLRTAMSGAVASLSLLPAGSTLESALLHEHADCGARLLGYYDTAYFEQKLTDPPTRKYARLLREPDADAAIETQADALVLSPTTAAAERVRLSRWQDGPAFAEIQSPCRMAFTYLGRGFHVAMGDEWSACYADAKRAWTDLYGTAGADYLDRTTYDGESCAHTTPGPPVLVANIEPLQRFAAKPGWGLLFEGCSQTLRWGLRGCIRSSRFNAGVFAFQWFGTPTDTVIEAGATLGRVIPIPLALLEATISVRPLAA